MQEPNTAKARALACLQSLEASAGAIESRLREEGNPQWQSKVEENRLKAEQNQLGAEARFARIEEAHTRLEETVNRLSETVDRYIKHKANGNNGAV